MKILEIPLWNSNSKEYIAVREDSQSIKEQFIKKYLLKKHPEFHDHIEVMYENGYRGFLWEFTKPEGRKIVGEKEAFQRIEKENDVLFFFDNSNCDKEKMVATIPDTEWKHHVYQCSGQTVSRLSAIFNFYDIKFEPYEAVGVNPFPQEFYVCSPTLSWCVVFTGEYDQGECNERLCKMYENG